LNIEILSIRQLLAFKLFQKNKNWGKEHTLPGGKQDRHVYIIRRSGRKLGLFSYFETILPRIEYALANNMVPVIDMCNFDNSIRENSKHNPWDDYFEQPGGVSLADAYKSKRITISEAGVPDDRPNDSMEFLKNVDGQLEYWKKIFSDNVIIKNDIRDSIDSVKNSLIGDDDKVLGVLARGTDYVRLKPAGHPVQPHGEAILKVVKQKIDALGYTKVYVATEDINIATLFRDELGEKCIIGKCDYVDYRGGFLADSKANVNGRTKDYLINIAILSECDGIVAGRTSGTVAAALMSKNWKDTYFFDLGLYE